ncbi:MAG: Maf family protein, partial [Sneathiella sp.]
MGDRKDPGKPAADAAERSAEAGLPTTHTPTLILASASPRRLDLLKQIGVTPDEVDPADIDESAKTDERPHDLAKRLASEKARVVMA